MGLLIRYKRLIRLIFVPIFGGKKVRVGIGITVTVGCSCSVDKPVSLMYWPHTNWGFPILIIIEGK